MYKVSSPLLGFEHLQNIQIEKIDENFSTLIFDELGSKLQVQIVNINYIDKIRLSYEIDDIILENMNITSKDDCEIYFCVVIQTPIENSIVNLISPIIINKKDKSIGQYVSNDSIEQVFATLKEASSLV